MKYDNGFENNCSSHAHKQLRCFSDIGYQFFIFYCLFYIYFLSLIQKQTSNRQSAKSNFVRKHNQLDPNKRGMNDGEVTDIIFC